jgi:hypothetical protein
VLPAPPHCFALGVQTGDGGHEHVPHAQLALHVAVPYVLQGSVALGEQTPWPEHVPSCQEPLTQVCVSVPQLVQGIGLVLPGAHDPEHAPFEQVSFTHATALPHWPHPSHVSTPFVVLLQRFAPGVQTGADGHEQPCQVQSVPQVCVPYVLHVWVAFGAHAPWPEHVPSCHVPLALHVWLSVPQFWHETLFVAPGVHEPVQAPWLQT